jgi:DNA polymerase I
VEAYFGVPPERVVDVQALAGRLASTMSPARRVSGSRPRRCSFNEFGDLDTLLARAD